MRHEWISEMHWQEMYKGSQVDNDSFLEVNEKDAKIWINGFDGDLGFYKGHFDCAAIIIGLMIGNYGRMGLIHMPFERLKEDN